MTTRRIRAQARAWAEVVQSLSRDIAVLKMLSANKTISLNDLNTHHLLPKKLGNRVSANTSGIGSQSTDAMQAFFKDIGTLTPQDYGSFTRLPSFGSITIYAVKCLKEIYVATDKFRCFEGAQEVSLLRSDAEQDALLSRITQRIRTDPAARAQLLAMFPAPVRAVSARNRGCAGPPKHP